MSSGDPQASETNDLTNPTSDAVDATPADGAVQASPTTDSPSTPEVTPEGDSSAALLARGSGPLAARGLGVARPGSPEVKSRPGQSNMSKPMGPTMGPFRPKGAGKPTGKPGVMAQPTTAGPGQPENLDAHAREAAEDAVADAKAQQRPKDSGHMPRIAVPNLRQPLGEDLLAELEAELADTDITAMLASPAGLEGRRGQLEEGQRIHAKVLKFDDDSVYMALGGPDEGAVSRLQFGEVTPEVGKTFEVVVRGYNREDGLYALVIPGQAIDVSDWEDLEEGTVVEAHISAANTGGLEATVGNIRGFIPISQIAQYRVEDTAEFVGQRMMCVVTECNPRRKNLVLSRRTMLEREREEQRQQQLEQIEAGQTLEGTVRSVKDFGAFVDLGGLDGLIHVTRLSWDHIKHPSDVLAVGQKVQVKIEKVDKQTGKIALSYRDLLENPWDSIEATLSVGAVAKGTVTRLANFGAFVRLGAGIEGLVHISELAGHRVSNVNSVIKEGEEVTVKVLSIERESQKIALSIKQAQSKGTETATKVVEEEVEPPRELAVKRQHDGPLKGGVGTDAGSNPFGLNW